MICLYARAYAHECAGRSASCLDDATGCFGCHLNIIIYYYVCRTTDTRYYYYSYNTRGIQRRAAADRRPRADWLPVQRARRVTPADLHTIYITRAQEIARPIVIYYNTRTGNISYLLDYTAAAADTCPRLGSTCTIIFDNAFLTHHIPDDCSLDVVCIRLLLCSFVAEKS